MAKKILFVVTLLVIGMTVAFQSFEKSFYLKKIPKELRVSEILYMNNKIWGFGPGGNETGIIVYKLPSDVAEQLSKEGIQYLKKISGLEWKESPLEISPYWSSKGLGDISFGIIVSKEIENLMEQGIGDSKNFYAKSRTGIIIVMPLAQRAIFTYQG